MLPLDQVPQGVRARVVEVLGGYGMRRRLLEAGLAPGTVVEVLKNDAGPLVVAVRGSKMALGRGMAKKVLVEPLEGEQHAHAQG